MSNKKKAIQISVPVILDISELVNTEIWTLVSTSCDYLANPLLLFRNKLDLEQYGILCSSVSPEDDWAPWQIMSHNPCFQFREFIRSKGKLRELQLLPNRNWLVLEQSTDTEPKNSLMLIDSASNICSRIGVGKGAESVQADSKGEIWVSFSDEGVFSADTDSRSGLVAFTEDGTITFKFTDILIEHSLSPIEDCYALNVVSESEVWLYYFSAYHLVKMENHKPTRGYLTLPHFSSHTIAISDEALLFDDDFARDLQFNHIDRNTGRATTYKPISTDGKTFRHGRTFARKNIMYFESQNKLYRLATDSKDWLQANIP